MKIALATLPTLRLNGLKELSKDRKISLGFSAKKEGLQQALRGWQEFERDQALLENEITTDSEDEDDGREVIEDDGDSDSLPPLSFQSEPSKASSEKSSTPGMRPKSLETHISLIQFEERRLVLEERKMALEETVLR
ncbi:hypothetical protein NDU88_007841 [Pleurodeles waltl]|uniref:Uncharacterized protein n=1 Tax=Pleurodeles waltl TaxID=8319 RepID=A0AAV7STM5_PLEWA|nr:hypothetical protein NDU88_007841 [Pleurodeles waltl]